MLKTAKWFGVLLLAVVFLPAAVWGQNCANGDLNNDLIVSVLDVAVLLNCVNTGSGCPALPKGDLNCDGFRDAADLILQLFCLGGGSGPLGPCPIANVRPTTADPRDSVILESKLVTPSSGPLAMTVRVWITNKDTLSGLALPLTEYSSSGSAYATLAYPRNFNGVVDTLTATLRNRIATFSKYNGSSPDSLLLSTLITTAGSSPKEPPNATRKAFFDIKFDSIQPFCGQMTFDSIRFLDHTVELIEKNGRRVPVNFVKGVVSLPELGDLDANGSLSPSDVVLMLNCVFLGAGSCDLCFADLNCDGSLTPSDVILQLNGVFLGTPLICP